MGSNGPVPLTQSLPFSQHDASGAKPGTVGPVVPDEGFVVRECGKRLGPGIRFLFTYQSGPCDNSTTFFSLLRPKTSGKRRQEYSSARKAISTQPSPAGSVCLPAAMIQRGAVGHDCSLPSSGVSKTPAKSDAFFTSRGSFNSGGAGAGLLCFSAFINCTANCVTGTGR